MARITTNISIAIAGGKTISAGQGASVSVFVARDATPTPP